MECHEVIREVERPVGVQQCNDVERIIECPDPKTNCGEVYQLQQCEKRLPPIVKEFPQIVQTVCEQPPSQEKADEIE